MKFSEVRQGDALLTLEQDRRSQFPIFDIATVQKISNPGYQRMGNDGGMVQVVTMTITDSTGTFNVVVPLDGEDTIYDKIYITPNSQLIRQEIWVQKSRAQQILSNIDRYKAIDTECDKILARLEPNQPNQNVKELSNSITADLAQKVEAQGKMLERIYNSLFLNQTESKEPPQ